MAGQLKRWATSDRRLAGTAGLVFAVVSVALTYLVRLGLAPWLADRAQFLPFLLPVVLCAMLAGRGAAMLAMILALIGALSFFAPEALATVSVQSQTFLFIMGSLGVIWLGARLDRTADQAARLRAARRAESLRTAEAGVGLRLLLEGATDYAIFMVDLDGRITTWNSGSRRNFGWLEEEAVGLDCALFYPPEDRDAGTPRADLDRAALEGRFYAEAWQVRKDGSEFLADVTITPLEGPEGEPRGFAKVIHDVTDRRAAERALQKRERHLESILATVPDAMVVIDQQGLITSFSAAAERLFGFTEADVVGRNVSMLMPSPDHERHDSYISRYLETNQPRIIGTGRIVTGLRADGSTFPMKLSVGEAIDEGQQRLFTGFVQDLTERRNIEARLEQLQSELIHVSRLSAMGTMASTLAHELNQPLTAIATYGEAAESILAEGEAIDKEVMREILGDMAAQSLRAGGIVRRLREFVARGDVAKSLEDLPKLINEASALALVGSREKGMATQFIYDPAATPVLVDKVQIQQVLINLLRNGVEAMENAPVRRLTVATRLVDPKTVEVAVRDTGPGIAPEIADRLFEAFASTKSSGMGLGLSICRTIIEAHGGRITAQPAEGGGTEFRFTLMHPPAEFGDG